MIKNKLQVILPDEAIPRFTKQTKKQNRSESNLARIYILEGLTRDEEREKAK